jgi:membrane protein
MRTFWRRAIGYARRSAMPPPPDRAAHRWTTRFVVVLRLLRRLSRRALSDRLPQRAAALAYATVLSVVPLLATTFAVVRFVGGEQGVESLMRDLASRYAPRATREAVDFVTAIVVSGDARGIGVVGLLLLLPVTTGLLRQVETALADVYRVPARPPWSPRFFLHAGLVLVGPALAVFGSQHIAAIEHGWVAAADRAVGPLLVTLAVLFVAYAYLPGRHVARRYAFAGAVFAAVLLEAGKVLFGLYVTHSSGGLRFAWGTVAFFPVALLWVFVAWLLVLIGAEVAASAHELDTRLRDPRSRVPPPGRRRQRGVLRRRAAWRSRAGSPLRAS